MDAVEQAVQTGVFGLALWLKCALAGAVVGSAVAVAQVFPGHWHPAWARRLVHWFSCPLFAGLAIGVVVALRGVPPLSDARLFWLVLCLVVSGFTALAGSVIVAYLSRNYDPDVTSKSKRASRRSHTDPISRANELENRLRALFRPPPTAEKVVEQRQNESHRGGITRHSATTAGQRAVLPPERQPMEKLSARIPVFPGKPGSKESRDSQEGSQGKLVKPIK